MTLYFLNFIFTTYILFIIFIHLLLVKRNFFLLKNINFLSKLSLKHLQFLTKLLITLNTLIIFNFFIRYLSNINWQWRKGNIILKKKEKRKWMWRPWGNRPFRPSYSRPGMKFHSRAVIVSNSANSSSFIDDVIASSRSSAEISFAEFW